MLDQPGSDEPMRSGGGGRGRGGGNGGGDGRGDGGEGRGPLAGAVLLGVWVAASLLGAFEGLWDRSDATIPMDTSRMRVSIVVRHLGRQARRGSLVTGPESFI